MALNNVRILPDEPLSAAIARVKWLNDPTQFARRRTKFFEDLRRNTPDQYRNEPVRIAPEFLFQADILGLSLSEAFENHSYLPYQGAFLRNWLTEEARPLAETLTLLRDPNYRPPSIALCRFCPCCRQEDLDTYHFAYFRRVHQILGMNVCPHHGVGLIQIPEKRNVSGVVPYPKQFRSFVKQNPPDEDSEVARGFRKLAARLMAGDQPRSWWDISESLEDLLSERLNVNIWHTSFGAYEYFQELNQRRDEKTAWLLRLVDETVTDEKRGVSRALAGVRYCDGRRVVINLALTLLLTESTQAAEELIFPEPPNCRNEAAKNSRPQPWSTRKGNRRITGGRE